MDRARRARHPLVAALVFLLSSSGLARGEVLAGPPTPVFVHHNVYTGLSHNRVTGITQDAFGYIWLGTLHGANRFDGQSFSVLTTRGPVALTGDRVRGLVATAEGPLWISSDNGIVRVDPRGPALLSSFTDSHRIPSGGPISSDGGAGLWIATRSALLHLDATGSLRGPEAATARLTNEGIVTLKLHPGTPNLLVATRRGLYELVDGSPPRAIPTSKPAVARLLTVRSGRVFIAFEDGGLDVLEPGSPQPAPFDAGIARGVVNGVAEMPDGSLWVGTTEGLYRIDRGSKTLFRAEDGLASTIVSTLFVDREGSLWIGTPAGVDRYSPAAVRFDRIRAAAFAGGPGLLDANVWALHEPRAGVLLVGTNAGLELLDRRNGRVERVGAPGLTGPVRSLLPSDDGGLLAVAESGVFRVAEPPQLRPLPVTGVSAPLRGGFRTRDGHLWLASARGLQEVDGGKARLVHGLELERVVDLHEDSRSVLWLAGSMGIARLVRGSPPVRVELPAASGWATGLSLRPSSRGLLASTTAGLFEIDLETAAARSAVAPRLLPSSVAYGAHEAGGGRLWIPTNDGLDLWDPARNVADRFSVNDGLAGNEFNALAVARTLAGELLLGGPEGVTVVPPAFEPRALVLPAPRSELEGPDGDLLTLAGRDVRLSQTDGFLRFRFGLLTYTRPESVNLEYRLSGAGERWSPAGPERSVTYPALAPGRYVFEVRAGSSGQPSVAAPPIRVEVVAPFWRRPGVRNALGACVLLALGSGGLVHLAATRRRQRRLERTIRSRTSDLEAERTRLAGAVARLADSESAAHAAREDAERAAAAKSAFLATMTHELRTPLQAVVGMTSLLSEGSLTAVQRDQLDTIRTSSSHLLSLIDDILDYSRIESGRMDIEEAPFSVETVLDEALELVGPRASEKRLDIGTEVGEGVPAAVVGDATRVRQILVNLLSNAIKFTDSGFVHVALTALTARGQEPDRFEVVFTVSDTGIGIPAERAESLFQPFTQAESSTTRRFGGTGLGLAISSRLARLMGGALTLESEPGRGSTFRLRVPLRSASSAARPAPPLAGVRARIAAEREVVLQSLRSSLESAGATVVPAGSRPDVAIVDLSSSGRIDVPPPGVPLVGLSFAPPDDPDALVGWVRAPASRRQLVSAIRSALGRDEPAPLPAPKRPRAWRGPVLVAEDQEMLRRVARGLLENLGETAELVEDGEAAVEAWIRGRHALVLMDVQMPRLDGLEATRRIMRLAAEAGVAAPYVVALTAAASVEDRARCHAAGMAAFLPKPFDLPLLENTLRRASSDLDARRKGDGRDSDERAVLDEAAFGSLGRALGVGNLPELAATFSRRVQESLELIETSIGKSGGLRATARLAHGMKGSAGTLGASRLAHTARELEASAERGEDATEIRRLLERARRELAATDRALEAAIAARLSSPADSAADPRSPDRSTGVSA